MATLGDWLRYYASYCDAHPEIIGIVLASAGDGFIHLASADPKADPRLTLQLMCKAALEAATHGASVDKDAIARILDS